jgi:hypothetical protein
MIEICLIEEGAMETPHQIFIFASPEIQELLADNETNLVELLNQEGIAVSRGYAQDPTQNRNVGNKEPVSILLATAALILALTPTISKVITALSHKTVEVEEMVLLPVEDSQGNVVHDAAGNPILQWIKRKQLKEIAKVLPEETSISLKAPTVGFELTYKASPKQP